MEIESIDIKSYHYFCGMAYDIDGVVHTKQLNSLSIVQSKIGSYSIQIENSEKFNTDEGGFFVAPSRVTQKITHHVNPQSHEFKLRFIFIDVIINKKYHMDDIFDFPIIIDKKAESKFDKDFDCYDNADTLCDKMSCIYQIIKHLLEISKEKTSLRNKKIYPLTEFIAQNYMRNINVKDMAGMMNMSESNLYAVFKKILGVSPVKYLNNYRLSVASEHLLNSNESIQSIAEAVGIPDQFYFSRIFREKYSMSPQQYRKSMKVFL